MHAHKQALEEIMQLEKWSNTAPKVRQRKKQQADARTEYANYNMIGFKPQLIGFKRRQEQNMPIIT